jgi:hypothetical protein
MEVIKQPQVGLVAQVVVAEDIQVAQEAQAQVGKVMLAQLEQITHQQDLLVVVVEVQVLLA